MDVTEISRSTGRRRSVLLLTGALLVAVIGLTVVLNFDEDADVIGWDPALQAAGGYGPPAEAEHQLELVSSIRDLPEEQPEGSVLRFAVRISNPGSEDVRLDPCPTFRMVVGESATLAEVEGMLRCDEADHIPAGGHVDFEMKIELTAQFDMQGENGVLWQLWGPSGPRWAGGQITVT